jgi:hypothetical protein
MLTYVCLLNSPDGQVLTARVLHAAHDGNACEQAMEQAFSLATQGVGYELWRDGRRVSAYMATRVRVTRPIAGVPLSA